MLPSAPRGAVVPTRRGGPRRFPESVAFHCPPLRGTRSSRPPSSPHAPAAARRQLEEHPAPGANLRRWPAAAARACSSTNRPQTHSRVSVHRIHAGITTRGPASRAASHPPPGTLRAPNALAVARPRPRPRPRGEVRGSTRGAPPSARSPPPRGWRRGRSRGSARRTTG